MLRHLNAATDLDLGYAFLGNTVEPDSEEVIYLMAMLRGDQARMESRRPDVPVGATMVFARPMSSFEDNPFLSVFIAIRDARARHLAENYEKSDMESAKSGKVDEDKAERSCEGLLHRFVEVIMLFFAKHTGNKDMLRRYDLYCRR